MVPESPTGFLQSFPKHGDGIDMDDRYESVEEVELGERAIHVSSLRSSRRFLVPLFGLQRVLFESCLTRLEVPSLNPNHFYHPCSDVSRNVFRYTHIFFLTLYTCDVYIDSDRCRRTRRAILKAQEGHYRYSHFVGVQCCSSWCCSGLDHVPNVSRRTSLIIPFLTQFSSRWRGRGKEAEQSPPPPYQEEWAPSHVCGAYPRPLEVAHSLLYLEPRDTTECFCKSPRTAFGIQAAIYVSQEIECVGSSTDEARQACRAF